MGASAQRELEPGQNTAVPPDAPQAGESPPSIASQLGFVAGTVVGAKDQLNSALTDITSQVNDAFGVNTANPAEPTGGNKKEVSAGIPSKAPVQTAVFERPKPKEPKIEVTLDQGGGIDISSLLVDLTVGSQLRAAKGVVAAAATAAAGFTLLQQKGINDSTKEGAEPVSRRQALKWLVGLGSASAAAGVLAACAPTKAPEKTGSSPPPTASTVIGELTPQAKDMVKDYSSDLVRYLQTEFTETKGVGGFPILNFVDARVNPNNPEVFSIFSNQPGISKVPTDKDLSFVIGGKMFIAIRNSKTGERVIYPVARPTVSYSSTRFNIEKNQLEYLDSSAKPIAHISITGGTVSDLISDIPSTATPAPINTPNPSPTAKPTPTEILVPRMPELSVSRDKFIAEGNEVVLRGAVADHFDYEPVGNQRLDKFKNDLDTLKSLGGNFIVIDWNAGDLDNSTYVTTLIQALEYAHKQGFRVEFALHSNGHKPNAGYNFIQIENADKKLIIDLWTKLFNNPGLLKAVKDNVDVINPWSEPTKNLNGGQLSWSEWKPTAEETILLIRQRLGKEIVGAISGVRWGGSAQDALNNPPTIKNVGIEVHPYKWLYDQNVANFQEYALELRKRGLLVFVGEVGYKDWEAGNFVEEQLKFFYVNGISFAVYGIDGHSSDPNFIINKFGVTNRGKTAQQYFSPPK